MKAKTKAGLTTHYLRELMDATESMEAALPRLILCLGVVRDKFYRHKDYVAACDEEWKRCQAAQSNAESKAENLRRDLAALTAKLQDRDNEVRRLRAELRKQASNVRRKTVAAIIENKAEVAELLRQIV